MNRQSGTTTVEFAVLASVFFVILLGTLEFSRLLFTWNMLNAVTQRGARVAAVCPPNDPAVKRVALFAGPDETPGLLPAFTTENLEIEYLNESFNNTGGTFPINFVRVSIVDYQHQLAIPFLPDSIVVSPPFSTTLPSESLGYNPASGVRSCFGA